MAPRILILDDEENIRQLLVRLCRMEGYEPLAAPDERTALALLEQSPLDLGIFDLQLPDGDGLSVLRRAKALYPDCEVIILTGHGGFESAIEALRLGAYDYLQKPIVDLQLIALVLARALERQRLSRHNANLLQDLQAANAELELRRRQQLQFINYIGHALVGALKPQDVACVLVRGILESTHSDGAGVLLLPSNGHEPWAIAGGPRRLSDASRHALLALMNAHLPHEHQLRGTCEVQELPEVERALPDDEPWCNHRVALLQVRDDLWGAAILASHREQPFSEEALGFFSIFVTQGSTALANAALFIRANELAARDGVTGLYNHRHFFDLLEAEISRAERHGQEFAVLMLDLDRGRCGLKTVNDTYGHQAGDEMLRTVAHFLQDNVRRADVVARYGGDEFIILAPQTGAQEAHILAQRICQKLHDVRFHFTEDPLSATMSVGVAVFRPGQGLNAIQIVALADRGLYLAKQNGGDQVCACEQA